MSEKMNDLQRSLEIWTKIATNTRLRDRMVKVIQYGCQMLIGYYGAKMSEDLLLGVKTTRRTASTARKAFWLLKSVNHIGSITTMLNENILEKSFVDQLDFIEQIFLVLYYLYENQIFLARCHLFNFNEDDLDWGCNVTWFVGDLAFFLSSGLRLYANSSERGKLLDQLAELNSHRQALTSSMNSSSSPIRNGHGNGIGNSHSNGTGTIDSQLLIRRQQQLESDIRKLSAAQYDLLLSFIIVRVLITIILSFSFQSTNPLYITLPLPTLPSLLARQYSKSACQPTMWISSKCVGCPSPMDLWAPWVSLLQHSSSSKDT